MHLFLYLFSNLLSSFPLLLRFLEQRQDKLSKGRWEDWWNGEQKSGLHAHVGLCPSHLPQWLTLEESEGEDVLSEKHWTGLIPGSVALFSLIKGETKGGGDDLPHTSPPAAELFNRCVPPPPSRSGLSSGNPSGYSVLVFVHTDPLTRSRIFLLCLKIIYY